MRAMWKGDISFGLVSIPIGILPVEEKQQDLHFHLLDSKDKSRVRYKRVNENTGKEVSWKNIVKGYEYDKGSYFIVEEEAFEKASPGLFKSIDIEEFVDFKEIDNLYFDKPYYIVPESKNRKAYVLLREALKKTKKVGVAKVIIRTKEYLSIIFPHDKALILNLIHFKEELREEDNLNLPGNILKEFKITDKELKMAVSLIKEMTTTWNPEKYHNDYRETLKKWINKKTKEALKNQTNKRACKSLSSQTDIVDFISLLKESMRKKDKVKSLKSASTRKK